ncbi:4Fe-4S single cluster domain-containing protein [Treponema sp.]|uniref:4Fe-4S single cluster domain-containing protein n=1 Tax=Treponema sp. TaxID=166 RepID=UPI003FA25A81
MPYISHYTETTQVLGPGNRFAVWFQGCDKRCPGCINPEGQKKDGGLYVSVDDLMNKIKNVKHITGVTISGGEPFLQFDELAALVFGIKKETELDILLYSGYLFEELTELYGRDFFNDIDIFIDGEYIKDLDKNAAYRGSDNQRIFFFTSKYKSLESEMLSSTKREIEFEFNAENELILIGVPPKNMYDDLLKVLSQRR